MRPTLHRLFAVGVASAVLAACLSGCGAAESRGQSQAKNSSSVPKANSAPSPIVKAHPRPDQPDSGSQQAKISQIAEPNKPPAEIREKSGKVADPRAIIALLRKARISTVDRTQAIPAPVRRELMESIRRMGGDDAVLYRTPDGFEFLAVGFSNQKSLETLLQSPPPVLLWQNIVLAPTGFVSSTWETIDRAVVKDGGRRIDSRALECHDALEMLKSLRVAIAKYQQMNGRMPDFSAQGWEELQSARLIKSAPRNPLSPRDVADRLEIVNKPGVAGESVSETKVGWVWNSSTNGLHIAGLSDSKLWELARGAPCGEHAIIMPDIQLAARLALLRDAIARLQTDGRRGEKVTYPTLAELVASFNDSCPANPLNDNRTIQAVQWNQRNPPTRGSAGWNYDSKTGKIWPNTAVFGENQF